MGQPQVDANGRATGLHADAALSIDRKLGVIPICVVEHTEALDVSRCIAQEITCPLKLERPRVHAIAQGEMLPHLIKPPPRRFVLHRPAVLLEPWVPFLPWFLRATILVEARDGRTGTLRRSLSGHGVKLADERVLLGKKGTVPVQIIGRNAGCVLPVPHTLVADEL